YESTKFGKNALWARPKAMFSDYVTIDGTETRRFEFIG
ncbi:MAG: DUF1653 domain-containing protein, partial [Candidatus Yonathbacteria bacterium CG_4_9_14_0_8_um_filter_46_47]